ncbi:site-specific integrase [Streptomyces sp. DSM 44915]|uniref:Site-specific integrase n=1 Tax=Streptomyces chisholmiae TaxID=3075540 RepID=A0ABU2JU75_9ACTN|nr:site-specific integrase [Streptomyces sp. DSM 44915]MDT0268311.1 site-specific integrase [Streptomyces sp. DSM 44915]
MPGHIQDRWFKDEKQPDGTTKRVKTDRHGTGLRYRARYIGPDGTEKSKSFPDRQKRAAEQWLIRTAADMAAGQYIDPKASRITFQQYAEKYLGTLTTEENSRAASERRLRLHAYPYIGTRPMGSFQPGHIRTWLRQLTTAVPSASHRLIIYGSVSSLFNAAVDDALLPKNPCHARSVKAPAPDPKQVRPWTVDQVRAVRRGLPEHLRTTVDVGAGCGLRQGEIFGLPLDNLDFEGGWLAVRQQLKRVRGKFVFALPKRGKIRDVPLPEVVADALREHMRRFPPMAVTLPWGSVDGAPVTKKLIFTGATGDFLRVSHFDDHKWKPALAAAGLIGTPEKGQRYPAAREHGMHALRHFYASVLLDGGENIRALSQYLGHRDPGFTLRVYTHLMPSSEGRTRNAVNRAFGTP